MKKIEIANDAHLSELVQLSQTDGIDFDEIAYQMQKLPNTAKLKIAKEYNESRTDSLSEAKLVAAMMDSYGRERIYSPEDAKDMLSALNKCTQTFATQGASTQEKHDLGGALKYFAIEHPETISGVFGNLEKLTDADVIDSIRSCMSRDSSLLDAGFAAIHKSADSICAKAEQNNWENPQFAASNQIRLAFADLYNYYGSYLGDMDAVDKITEHFADFDKQIRRVNPEKSKYIGGNLEGACQTHHNQETNEFVYKKMQVLENTFREFEQSDKPFKEIYTAELAGAKEELERLEFVHKVKQKIRSKAEPEDKDFELLRKMRKTNDYAELKRAGDTDFNKMLMQARKDSRKK